MTDRKQDEPHNLILDHLRHIRGAVDRMENDIRDLKFRMGQVEQTLAHHSSRFDRVDERLHTIEERLGLVDA